MVLDDERCMEMYLHCRQTLQDRAVLLKMVVPDGSAFPIIKKHSVLLLRPVFKVVNTFPIDERATVVDGDDVHRPMYYCELHGKAMNDIWKRKAMRRKKKRSVCV